MTKLEEAARALIADYDVTNQPDNIWTTLPVQWPQLEALRAALAEHAAKREGLTEGRIREIWNEMLKDGLSPLKFARAIESEVRK